jgi:hypothetical protein
MNNYIVIGLAIYCTACFLFIIALCLTCKKAKPSMPGLKEMGLPQLNQQTARNGLPSKTDSRLTALLNPDLKTTNARISLTEAPDRQPTQTKPSSKNV